MTKFLWSVYPYICFTLFFVVPIIRMIVARSNRSAA